MRNLILLGCALQISLVLSAQPLAFPHAEGYGRFAKGGRGGDVYRVTSLDDYNPKTDKPIPGTFRYGLSTQEGPRTIVFDVSGTIALTAPLKHEKSFLTIAGQTAPGDGITIRNYNFKLTGVEGNPVHDIIIRFVRFRLGDTEGQEADCLSTNWINDFIMDHVSASWAVDATHDLRDAARFTMQWSILSESLNESVHSKGSHAMMSSYSHLRGNVSLHHNLFASGRNRHPTLGAGTRTDTMAIIDFRNNVVYNWDSGSNFGQCRVDMINNYYKPGPSTNYNRNKPLRTKSEYATSARAFLRGNYFESAPDEFNTDNYTAMDYNHFGYVPGKVYTGNYISTTREQFESKVSFVTGNDLPKTDSYLMTYHIVLERSGAIFAQDKVDKRVVAGVKDGTNRLINSQDEVGGFPALDSKNALPDTDGDGMPDDWEIRNGLNPNDPSDRNGYTLNQHYTNLEVYLNSLVDYLYTPYTETGDISSLEWSARMADSEIARYDPLVKSTDSPNKWQYDIAWLAGAIGKLSDETGDDKYFQYMKTYMDYYINPDGTARYYELEEYNLDRIRPAVNLFTLWHKTGDNKYKIALQNHIQQLKTHPRTSDRGYWHKKIYPYQMWLDGLFMAGPFMAQYAAEFNDPQWFDEVTYQITLIYRHTLDPMTGLLYHAWDESRKQRWSSPETGQSPHFWSRAMGWYLMAIVDVLDFLPMGHPDRQQIIDILNRVSEALLKVRDPESGLWYQVTDAGGREGNYLEASGSGMFVYAFAKGAQKGYLPANYLDAAKKTYQGIVTHLISTSCNGLINLEQTCGGAGLGGNPYRDGSYNYYITEKIRQNDCKGVAAFILSGILLKNQ